MLLLGLLLLSCCPLIQSSVEVHQEFVASQRVSLRFEIVTTSHDDSRPLPMVFNLFPHAPKTNLILLDTFTPVFNFSIQLIQSITKQPLGDRIYRRVQLSGTNQPWFNDTFTTASGISLSVATKIDCAPHFFGNRCENFCNGHLAKAARKRCDAMGRLRCDIGWMGPHCEHTVDPRKCMCENNGICASSYIHNATAQFDGGHLMESIGQLICECTNGFTGNRCEIPGFTQFQLTARKPDACSVKDACLNGAKCFPNGPKAFCSCAVGFMGEFCEISLYTTSPTIEITVKSTGYSYAVYVVVGTFACICAILGCFTYKLKPRREHALARGQAPEPYPVPEAKSMLVCQEASYEGGLPKKVFTIEDSVKKADEEERYTSAPSARSYNTSSSLYAEIQKPRPPNSCVPPAPVVCHYV